MITFTTNDGRRVEWSEGQGISGDDDLVRQVEYNIENETPCGCDYWGEIEPSLDTAWEAYLTICGSIFRVTGEDPEIVGVPENPDGYEPEGPVMSDEPVSPAEGIVAACYSAACRPPTSGGTGGSGGKAASGGPRPATRAAMGGVRVSVGGKTVSISARPKVVDAASSPHYKRRTAGEVHADLATVQEALASDKRSMQILAKGNKIADGQVVGIRPNLNVLKNTGVLTQTVHAGSPGKYKAGTTFADKEALTYLPFAVVRDANLTVNQLARKQIASGEVAKFPMSSVDGKFVARPGSDAYDGVELKFNPRREHVYVDPDGRPVKRVEEATVAGVGPAARVYARGKIEYYDESDFPQPLGGVESAAKLD